MEICTTQLVQLAESLIAQSQFNFEDLSSEKIGLLRFKFMQDFGFEFFGTELEFGVHSGVSPESTSKNLP